MAAPACSDVTALSVITYFNLHFMYTTVKKITIKNTRSVNTSQGSLYQPSTTEPQITNAPHNHNLPVTPTSQNLV